MGFGKGFNANNDAAVRRVVGTRWTGGQSYSGRIWGSAGRLAGHNGKVYLILPGKREGAFARLVEWLQMSKELTSDSREAEDMARRAFLDENVRKRWMQCVEIRAGSR
ncbi:hypothetical protein [uncultured Parolsenella sp.]|uniref:hypothetical protein n=1 Tax=uncultured Parolsenella sp. TaxID=2083008 RepID=UPI0025EED0C2|nr:hypothetical protein [uncultured Parolsenella sp.]